MARKMIPATTTEAPEASDWCADLLAQWAAARPKLATALRLLSGDLCALEARPARESRRGDGTPWWQRNDGATLAADWRCAIYHRQLVGGPMWVLNEARRAGWHPKSPTSERIAALRQGSVAVQCRALGAPVPRHAMIGTDGQPGYPGDKIVAERANAIDGTRYQDDGGPNW